MLELHSGHIYSQGDGLLFFCVETHPRVFMLPRLDPESGLPLPGRDELLAGYYRDATGLWGLVRFPNGQPDVLWLGHLPPQELRDEGSGVEGDGASGYARDYRFKQIMAGFDSDTGDFDHKPPER
jgi:hypothetical protein